MSIVSALFPYVFILVPFSLHVFAHTSFFFPCILPNSENRFSVFFSFRFVSPFRTEEIACAFATEKCRKQLSVFTKGEKMCVRFYGKKEKTVERFGMWQRIMHHFLSAIVPHTRVCVRPSVIRVIPGFRLTPPVNQPKMVFFPFPLFSAV